MIKGRCFVAIFSSCRHDVCLKLLQLMVLQMVHVCVSCAFVFWSVGWGKGGGGRVYVCMCVEFVCVRGGGGVMCVCMKRGGGGGGYVCVCVSVVCMCR